MTDDFPIVNGLPAEEETDAAPVQPNCLNCAHYATCQVRTQIPKHVRVLETQQGYPWPTDVLAPMPCGGNAWEKGDEIKRPERAKPAGMTWSEWYQQVKGRPMKTTDVLKELPK